MLPGLDGTRSAAPGATGAVLVKFLCRLKAIGLQPSFFGCDKDKSEIAAISSVYPSTVQLCLWHALRAIKKKLAKTKEIGALSRYHPAEARELVPTLDICWGSFPEKRPAGEHRYGGCDCSKRTEPAELRGKIECQDELSKNIILQTFKRHFNAHPLIPDSNNVALDSESLHKKCATEMYELCRRFNWFRLWAYLYVNWYKTDQWVLWARSANPNEIPVLKTTMIVESHWRRIKRDYLWRYNRPRIDLVTWVLLSSVLPAADRRPHFNGINHKGPPRPSGQLAQRIQVRVEARSRLECTIGVSCGRRATRRQSGCSTQVLHQPSVVDLRLRHIPQQPLSGLQAPRLLR